MTTRQNQQIYASNFFTFVLGNSCSEDYEMFDSEMKFESEVLLINEVVLEEIWTILSRLAALQIIETFPIQN